MTTDEFLAHAAEHLRFPKTVPSTAHVQLLRHAVEIITELRKQEDTRPAATTTRETV